ncbi:MAG: methyltransferase domain-containing protein [Nitrosopumilaceae archaeon]
MKKLNDENELRNIIRKNYLEILNREPDEDGLNHYLTQMKKGKITSDDLRKIFMNSQEYKYLQLVKLRNPDLPISERMKRDWDDRANTDAKFFIRAVYNQNEHEFWESGKTERDNILGNNSKRYDLITDGKNPKEMKVLEIGCGIGRILIPMATIFGEAVGVDVSSEMIKISQKHVKKISNCKIFENNGSDLSMFPDNYFDFCYSYIVFQHIPEKAIVKNYIKEVSRILKSGKIFRFQVHGDYDKNPTDGTTWNGVHFTSHEMHQIANESKFVILEEEGQNDRYYWLTFKSIKNA